jgi:hypothetical protein
VNPNLKKIAKAEIVIIGSIIFGALVFTLASQELILNWLFNPHMQGGGWGLYAFPVIWFGAFLVIVVNFPSALKAILKNCVDQTPMNYLIVFSPIVVILASLIAAI